jgi:hypothetical protein
VLHEIHSKLWATGATEALGRAHIQMKEFQSENQQKDRLSFNIQMKERIIFSSDFHILELPGKTGLPLTIASQFLNKSYRIRDCLPSETCNRCPKKSDTRTKTPQFSRLIFV